MAWFDEFEQRSFEVNGATINARTSKTAPGALGSVPKPALLLLHGFPQSHVMWHRVAQQLANDYFLVMPDLRGYGDSSKTPGLPDHSNYSKRNMAHDMALVMDALGIDKFYLCGHDRGGRSAGRPGPGAPGAPRPPWRPWHKPSSRGSGWGSLRPGPGPPRPDGRYSRSRCRAGPRRP